MNYIQPYPFSLDYWVQQAQTRLYNLLYTSPQGFGLNSSNCNSFGRVYRNKTNDGYIPEAFYNGEYIASNGQSVMGGLFFEKGFFVSFFSLVENNKVSNFDYVAKMELIIFADMSIITPSLISTTQQRLDEVLLSKVESFITFNGYGFQVKKTTFDIDKVLERYSGTAKKNALNNNLSDSTNALSFCALKLNIELRYDPGQVQTNLPVFQNNPTVKPIVLQIVTVPDLTKVIPVGNGQVFIYQQYAPGNSITPMTTTGKPYLEGLLVTLISVNNTQDSLSLEVGAAISANNGVWNSPSGTYTGNTSGDPYALNNGDFVNIIFNDLT